MSNASASHPFDQDTAVDKVTDGHYAATVTDRWSALTGHPNGGYLQALALRALGEGTAHPDPVSVATFYQRPGNPGPAEVHTEIAREGRRLATGEARVLQQGREVIRTMAHFGDLRNATGPEHRLAAAPELPEPAECLDPLAELSLDGLSIARQVEYRTAQPFGFMQGAPSGMPQAEFWMRLRGGREPDLLALAFLVDAAAPAVLELGEPPAPTVELTTHLRARPAPGWLACRVQTRHVSRGFHEEDFEIWDVTGTLVAQSRQLAMFP